MGGCHLMINRHATDHDIVGNENHSSKFKIESRPPSSQAMDSCNYSAELQGELYLRENLTEEHIYAHLRGSILALDLVSDDRPDFADGSLPFISTVVICCSEERPLHLHRQI